MALEPRAGVGSKPESNAPSEPRDPLEEPPPAFDPSRAAEAAERVFGIAGSSTALPSERDLNFRLDAGRRGSFVVKISNPAEDPAVVDMQTRAVLHVARHDPSLPVMRPVPTEGGQYWAPFAGSDGRVSLVRMFTFLEGHNPQTLELDARALRAWGAVVARLGRALRGFFHPAAGQDIQWDLKRASSLRPLLAHVEDEHKREVVGLVLDRFEANAAPVLGGLRAQVIHNDMSLDNVLVDATGRITGIVDFGDMVHTALVCDLAVTLSDVLDGRPDALAMAPELVAGYASVTPLDQDEARVLGDLVAMRSAAAIVIGARGLALHPENREYLSTFGQGAWRLLQLFVDEGFDQWSRTLREASRTGVVSRGAVPSGDLMARRRRVLGSGKLSPLSYRQPLHLVRGQGVWLFDAEGGRYLDGYNNVAVVGHAHPRVADAIATQARTLNTNTRYLHEAAVRLAERLVATMPPGLDRVLFLNSGSEANDVAWRIATAATGRTGAIVSSWAYHGITEATAALSPEEWPEGERPDHVEVVPAPDGYRGAHRREEAGWAERYASQVGVAADALSARGVPAAAMFADAAFTSGGVLCPPAEYLQRATDEIHRAGGLFVADEVQIGHGRSGRDLWAFRALGVEPDLVTMGKPMGNGHPVAAVVTTSDLADRFAGRGEFFSTFGGNQVACVAALAVLDVIEDEGLIAGAAHVGEYLRAGVRSFMERHEVIGDVRGMGLLTGVELVRDRSTRVPAPEVADNVVNGMRRRGVLIGATGPQGNVLKIRPPLVFGREHADLMLGALDEALGTPEG